ncbi:MAG TPA: sigma-70 family RNA polymerase sigma factor, partial [Kofleriaceae bacterium]
LAGAHAARPAGWVADAAFIAHAGAHARACDPADAGELHAADLYLALACAHGVPAALEALEREHLVRIREFAASVDRSPGFVAELTQQLRARVLVAEPGRPARIASYSGRGSLGAWIRVTAVRLARDLARAERGAERRDELPPAAIDPEVGYLKRAYGDAVNQAMATALAALAAEPRALLKMHYVDGRSIDQVGLAFGKSRATAARMLAAARLQLVADIRAALVATIGIRADEADSLLAFVRSRLDVSLASALR